MDLPVDEMEAGALEEFKALVEVGTAEDDGDQTYYDDYFYLRWLRARSLNLPKAKLMLDAYLSWRRTLATLPPTPRHLLKVYKEELVVRETGVDYQGRPVFFILAGRAETRTVLESGSQNVVSYLTTVLDGIHSASEVCRKRNGGVTQVVGVVDLEGLTFSKVVHVPTIQLVIELAKIFEAYYPELLHKCVVVNVTWVFTSLYNLVKPFLSAATIQKLTLYSYDPSEWRPELEALAPPEAIPMEFGGSGESIVPPQVAEAPKLLSRRRFSAFY